MAHSHHSSDVIDLSLPVDCASFDSWIIGICSTVRSRKTTDIQESDPRNVQTSTKTFAHDRYHPATLRASRLAALVIVWNLSHTDQLSRWTRLMIVPATLR
jgi:predicted protein tyrosine phosphatase